MSKNLAQMSISGKHVQVLSVPAYLFDGRIIATIQSRIHDVQIAGIEFGLLYWLINLVMQPEIGIVVDHPRMASDDQRRLHSETPAQQL